MTDEQLAKIKANVRASERGTWLEIDSDDLTALIARLEAAESRALSAYNEGIETAATSVNYLISHGTSFRRDAVKAIRALLKDET